MFPNGEHDDPHGRLSRHCPFRPVSPRTRSALLWGLVGAMAFLALAQGYRLLASLGLGTLALVGVAVVVGGVTALLAYVAEPRLVRLGGNEQC